MPDLFSWERHIDSRTLRARTLVVMLGSFIDAGNVQQLLTTHIRQVCSGHVVGHFDADSLIDYRDSRPTITFDRDHFTDYVAPEFGLAEMTDSHSEKFMLLTGPEPALRWEKLAAEIAQVVARLDIKLVVIAQSAPMMTPHTRKVAITKHASDPDLIPVNRPLFDKASLLASFPFLLEMRLAERGIAVVGLSAHVPHYLTQTDFPDAAIALMSAIREVSGLQIPLHDLEVSAELSRDQLATHMKENAELAEAIQLLEQQYDALHKERELPIGESDLPTADEIGAEAEKFLQQENPNKEI
ncbi:MAG: PAC2 family protein [Propionibacteriaceae bacterium]